MNLSFSGCGFLCIYHVGVASCFRQYAPHILVDKIAGASAGALAACALICNVPLGESTSDVLRIAVKARSRTLGPFHPGFDLNKILYEGIVKLLPKDAHLQCNGRLHISVTRCSDGENVLLSQFNSREELIQALLCSCFIPFYSGVVPPKVSGVFYIDGGFSDNQPILDENTITVSPFAGESDICPEDVSFNVLQFSLSNTSIAISAGNLYRFASTLYPPHPEVLSQMCQQGFDDALKFLQRNNIISCTKCLAVQSSFGIAENKIQTETKDVVKDNDHPDDDCIDCRYRRQKALRDILPVAVVKAIEDVCDQMNKGVINWLFKHQPIKILPFITLPYILPFDITVVIIYKLWLILPMVQKEMKNVLEGLAVLAKKVIHKFDDAKYSAKFSCQLAITEFDYANKEKLFSTFKSMIDTNAESSSFIDELSQTTEFENKQDVPQKRMSYAGWCNVPQPKPLRRKSVSESAQPERVIKNMKFGFTVDLAEAETITEQKKKKVVDAFKSFKNNSEMNAFDIANKVLDWEKDYIEYIEPQNADTFEHVLEVTNSNDAVIAFFYEDNMKVKVTEIFNITEEEEASIVMSDEENELNTNLQWDSDYDMCTDCDKTDIEDNFDSCSESSTPSIDLETVDSYSREVHGDELSRARKMSVYRKSSLVYLNE